MIERESIRKKTEEISREVVYGITNQSLLTLIEKQNDYLLEHPRAKVSTAKRKIESKSKKLKIDGWACVSWEERTLSLSKDTEKLQEVEKLDGCYALKTDLTRDKVPKEMIHNRYKDLALVEWAF